MASKLETVAILRFNVLFHILSERQEKTEGAIIFQTITFDMSAFRRL